MTLDEFVNFREHHAPKGSVYFEDLPSKEQRALKEKYIQDGMLLHDPSIYPFHGFFNNVKIIVLGPPYFFKPYTTSGEDLTRPPPTLLIEFCDKRRTIILTNTIRKINKQYLLPKITLRPKVSRGPFYSFPETIRIEHMRHVWKAFKQGKKIPDCNVTEYRGDIF